MDQRKRLRVVDDDEIVVDMIPHRVLVHHLLVGLHLQFREVDVVPLKRVVDLLGDAEEIRPALQDPPTRMHARRIHQQRKRGKKLGHTAAVIGGTDIDDVQIRDTPGLAENTVDGFRSDKGFVVLDRDQSRFLHRARWGYHAFRHPVHRFAAIHSGKPASALNLCRPSPLLRQGPAPGAA